MHLVRCALATPSAAGGGGGGARRPARPNAAQASPAATIPTHAVTMLPICCSLARVRVRHHCACPWAGTLSVPRLGGFCCKMRLNFLLEPMNAQAEALCPL